MESTRGIGHTRPPPLTRGFIPPRTKVPKKQRDREKQHTAAQGRRRALQRANIEINSRAEQRRLPFCLVLLYTTTTTTTTYPF